GGEGDVGGDGEAVGAEAVEGVEVAGDEAVFEGAVLHAAEHPPDQRAVGEGDEGAARAALGGGGLVERVELELVAEGGDDLDGDVEAGVVALGGEVFEVAGAVAELGEGLEDGRLV